MLINNQHDWSAFPVMNDTEALKIRGKHGDRIAAHP